MVLLCILSVFYTEIIFTILFFLTGLNPYILAIAFSVSSSAFAVKRKWAGKLKSELPTLYMCPAVQTTLKISAYFSLVPLALLFWQDFGNYTIFFMTLLLRFSFGFLYYYAGQYLIALPVYLCEKSL